MTNNDLFEQRNAKLSCPTMQQQSRSLCKCAKPKRRLLLDDDDDDDLPFPRIEMVLQQRSITCLEPKPARNLLSYL